MMQPIDKFVQDKTCVSNFVIWCKDMNSKLRRNMNGREAWWLGRKLSGEWPGKALRLPNSGTERIECKLEVRIVWQDAWIHDLEAETDTDLRMMMKIAGCPLEMNLQRSQHPGYPMGYPWRGWSLPGQCQEKLAATGGKRQVYFSDHGWNFCKAF